MPKLVRKPPRLRLYVFIDIVEFTKIRPIEEQLAAIEAMNRIVRETVSSHIIAAPAKFSELVTYLPTGDGMCIVLENIHFDMHLNLAFEIWARSRIEQIAFRTGVGQGNDHWFRDINDRDNYAGQGLNSAARAMVAAERDEIVVTEDVFNAVHQHREYHGKFQRFVKVVKKKRWVLYRWVWARV